MANIITPVCRISFPNVWRPSKVDPTDENEKPKYSATFVFEDVTGIGDLINAVRSAATDRWGAKAVQMLKQGKIKSPFLTDDEDKWGYPEGAVFIRAKTDRQPGVVTRLKGEDGKPIKTSEEDGLIYAGARVKASVRVYTWEHRTGGKGVSFGLNNIQFWDHDERWDNSVPAEEEFDADMDAGASLEDVIGGGDSEDEPEKPKAKKKAKKKAKPEPEPEEEEFEEEDEDALAGLFD